MFLLLNKCNFFFKILCLSYLNHFYSLNFVFSFIHFFHFDFLWNTNVAFGGTPSYLSIVHFCIYQSIYPFIHWSTSLSMYSSSIIQYMKFNRWINDELNSWIDSKPICTILSRPVFNWVPPLPWGRGKKGFGDGERNQEGEKEEKRKFGEKITFDGTKS